MLDGNGEEAGVAHGAPCEDEAAIAGTAIPAEAIPAVGLPHGGQGAGQQDLAGMEGTPIVTLNAQS